MQHVDSNIMTIRRRFFAMQDVLKIAVEAGADSEKYPVSWIFHQKVNFSASSIFPEPSLVKS